MTVEERLKLDEAKRKLEAVRDSWIKRGIFDQYSMLQKVINGIDIILNADLARCRKSQKGGENDDDRQPKYNP